MLLNFLLLSKPCQWKPVVVSFCREVEQLICVKDLSEIVFNMHPLHFEASLVENLLLRVLSVLLGLAVRWLNLELFVCIAGLSQEFLLGDTFDFLYLWQVFL